MSALDVTNTGNRVTHGNQLDLAGAKELVTAFGKSTSLEELKAALDVFQKPGLIVAPEADRYFAEVVDTLRGLHTTKDELNRRVAEDAPRFEAEEAARLRPGQVTKSFAGTEIPEAVKALVKQALAAGARPYDVRRVDDPEWNQEHGAFELSGHYTPYPQEIAARGSMAFAHTEITPKKLADDMATEQRYTQIDGYTRTQVAMPFGSGGAQEITTPKYKEVVGKGTGNITAHYDESHHRDVYARGAAGQIWSNNCAVLSDGSLHGLPAMRRSEHTRHILTNPSLARGQRLLANFHLEVRGGVVTGLGLSGRLQKLINDGELKLVDPLAILRAWGFQIAPNCRVTFEGRGPAPKIDDGTHVIG